MKASRMVRSSDLIAVCLPGPCMDLTQRRELGGGRWRRLGDCVRIADLPAGVAVDLLARDAGMDRYHGHFLGDAVRLEDAEIGNQPGRSLGLDAEARAVIAALAVTERGEEVDLLDEAAFEVVHDDEDLAARGRDLGRAAAARQPCLRLVIVAHHRSVEVGEPVDLRAAEEADSNAAAL